MDEGRNMILLFPTLIKLETEEAKLKFKPKCHMFYGQRVIDIPDGLPKVGWNESRNDLVGGMANGDGIIVDWHQ